MCAISMISDYYRDTLQPHWQQIITQPYNPGYPYPVTEVSKAEFDALKAKVEDIHALLLKAKDYDERTNQPHCEMEEKVEFLKKLAKFVGIDLSDVFADHVSTP